MTSSRKSDGHEGYRPNVGLMLIAPDRRVFVGCRANQPDAWQMPQGGIDDGESTIEAACRELYEEIGTTRHRSGSRWPSPATTPISTSMRTTRNSRPGAGSMPANSPA
jgi:8-oxo-dGTP pyrophosphatase MutT (NUDIX family)